MIYMMAYSEKTWKPCFDIERGLFILRIHCEGDFLRLFITTQNMLGISFGQAFCGVDIYTNVVKVASRMFKILSRIFLLLAFFIGLNIF